MKMNEKICMITGANSGIGKETALELARMGATVVMVCRDRDRGEAALQEIKEESGNDSVELMVADLASQRQIRRLVDDFRNRYEKLHLLINNAGVSMEKRTLTEDRIEYTFAVNHLACFLLTTQLMDPLTAAEEGRIVNVSSGAHRHVTMNFSNLQGEKKFKHWQQYSQTKLANILFTYELARRLDGTGITANSIQPGLVKTEIWNKIGESTLKKFFVRLISPFMQTPKDGAKTLIYAATAPELKHVSGRHFAKCQESIPTDESQDPLHALKLWEISEKLTSKSR